MTNNSVAEDEDIFHSEYRVFFDALSMLASSPETQCEAMGDYNVAWELKDDVQAGRYLVNRGYLNPMQEAWVLAMSGALDAVPAQILPAGSGRANNLIAMQHPTWVPLRAFATQVLDVLEPLTLQNASYLRLEH